MQKILIEAVDIQNILHLRCVSTCFVRVATPVRVCRLACSCVPAPVRVPALVCDCMTVPDSRCHLNFSTTLTL
jgi:hypothetical protein